MMNNTRAGEFSWTPLGSWLATFYPDRLVRRMAAVLLVVIAMLVLCHVMSALVNKVYPNDTTAVLRDFFGLEREGSVTTWFSSLQLALIGLTCGGLFLSERVQRAPLGQTIGWLGLASVFLFLSLDEAAQVHERLDQVLSIYSRQIGVATVTAITTDHAFIQDVGLAAYSYMLLYVPVFVAVLYISRRFIARRGASRATQALWLAGFLGFAVKLGLEPFEAWLWQTVLLGHNVMVEVVIIQMTGLLMGEALILTALISHVAGQIRPSVDLSRVA